jgi:hypothetical protein
MQVAAHPISRISTAQPVTSGRWSLADGSRLEPPGVPPNLEYEEVIEIISAVSRLGYVSNLSVRNHYERESVIGRPRLTGHHVCGDTETRHVQDTRRMVRSKKRTSKVGGFFPSVLQKQATMMKWWHLGSFLLTCSLLCFGLLDSLLCFFGELSASFSFFAVFAGDGFFLCF